MCDRVIHWNDYNTSKPNKDDRYLVKVVSKRYNTPQIDSADFTKGRFSSTLLDEHGNEYDIQAWARYE